MAGKKDVFLGDGLSFAAKEAYKLLRTNIIFSLPKAANEKRARIVGITSSLPGEYKSTTATNLVYSFAESGKRVLLIDCDMRRSDLADRFEIDDQSGLSDFLVGENTLDQIYHRNVLTDNFDLMLAGHVPPNPSELLGSGRMQALVDMVAAHYDYIILDLPPVTSVSDALVAAKYCDGVLIVVRQEGVKRAAVRETLRQLSFIDARILGFVYTGSKANGKYYKKYGKYGSYGYYK